MCENWFSEKVNEITASEKSETNEKKNIDRDLQKNVAYIKQQFGDAFDVKYRKYNAQGKEIIFIMVDVSLAL